VNASHRDNGVAEPNTPFDKHVDHHRLRPCYDQDPAGVHATGLRAFAPAWKTIQHQRQQHRIVAALGEDRQRGAAVDRADEVRQCVGKSIQV
jgi:hypothetical protein